MKARLDNQELVVTAKRWRWPASMIVVGVTRPTPMLVARQPGPTAPLWLALVGLVIWATIIYAIFARQSARQRRFSRAPIRVLRVVKNSPKAPRVRTPSVPHRRRG